MNASAMTGSGKILSATAPTDWSSLPVSVIAISAVLPVKTVPLPRSTKVTFTTFDHARSASWTEDLSTLVSQLVPPGVSFKLNE
jgi:hypothetical protein